MGLFTARFRGARLVAVGALAAGVALTGCSKSSDSSTDVTARAKAPDVESKGVNLAGVTTLDELDQRFTSYKGPYELVIAGKHADGTPSGTNTSRRDRTGTVYDDGVMPDGTVVFAEYYQGSRCVGREGSSGPWEGRTLSKGQAWSSGTSTLSSPTPPLDGADKEMGVTRTLKVSDGTLTVSENASTTAAGGMVVDSTVVYHLDDDGLLTHVVRTGGGSDETTTMTYTWSSPTIEVPEATAEVGPNSDNCAVAGAEAGGDAAAGADNAGADNAGSGAATASPDTANAYQAAKGIGDYALAYSAQTGQTSIDDNTVRASMTGWGEFFTASTLRDGRTQVVSIKDKSDVACLTFTDLSYSVADQAC